MPVIENHGNLSLVLEWWGAGVGVGMLRGVLGFLVFWFLGFLVSWFQSLLVSKLLGFKVSKIYQISISCFLEDIDPIFKILEKYIMDLHEFPVPAFPHFSELWFSDTLQFT